MAQVADHAAAVVKLARMVLSAAIMAAAAGLLMPLVVG
jgi:hypothetical protein